MAEFKKPSTLVTCDICHREFALTKGCLTENKVTLEKRDLDPKEVVLTTLECPVCGKQYPVTMDDDETLDILQEIIAVQKRRLILEQKKKRANAHINKRYFALEQKLGFKRKQLASEYNRSFYQTADGKQQLDFHYHE